jgi:site-specific recombinase XerD
MTPLVLPDAGDGVVPRDPRAVIPPTVRRAGPRAEQTFAEFFAATIRNANTRMAYLRAATKFFAWVEAKRVPLEHLRPLHVAAYVEHLGRAASAPTVKQNLAAVRMLLDFLVVNHVLEVNPAAAVRGPKHAVKKGKTPVLDADETRQLLTAIDPASVVGLRDRAVIALMVYTFARVGALVAMDVEDYYPQGKRWWVRLHEKGGKRHEVPAHHKLEEYLDAYLAAAGFRAEKRGPLFRTAAGKTKQLTPRRLSRRDVYALVRRRAADAGIPTAICCHTFRATGITNYLTHGGTLEKAQQLANHESAKTTKLYDRRDDKLTLDEVEKITI